MSKTFKIAIVAIAALLALGTGVGLVAAAKAPGGQPTLDSAAENDVPGLSIGEDLASYYGPGGQLMGRFQGQALKVTAERVATALGITVEDLKAQIAEGKTLAEIAEAQGVSQEVLVTTILAPASDILDVLVGYGYLTAEQAANRLEKASEKVETLINRSLGASLDSLRRFGAGQNREVRPWHPRGMRGFQAQS